MRFFLTSSAELLVTIRRVGMGAIVGKINSSYDKDWDIVFYEIDGEIGFEEVMEEIERYYVKGIISKYTLWDFSNAHTKATGDDMIKLAAHVRKYAALRSGGADAIVVPNLLMYGLARMYSIYSEVMEKNSKGLKITAFRTKSDALSWLKLQAAAAKNN